MHTVLSEKNVTQKNPLKEAIICETCKLRNIFYKVEQWAE